MSNTYPDEVCLAWLAGCGLPLKTMQVLLETFDTPYDLLSTLCEKAEDLISHGIDPAVVRKMRARAEEKSLEELERTLNKYSIRVIQRRDTEYPKKLRNISDAPAILFLRGNTDCLNRKTVAMVGSRNASVKGLNVTGRIAKELSEHGVCVVSGLADGIDSAAHRGCLKGGTPTVAVMGCGLDRVYPASNRTLYEDILEGDGLLISEYAPGEKPLGWHFPVRNRIISGLSDAVLMMECRVRSGSMTTVRHALDQGKDVYAYPGESGTPWSEGAHQLLREGAGYFTTAADILEDLGCLDKNENSVQNNLCSKQESMLTSAQQKTVDALRNGMQSFDQLLAATGAETAELSVTLTYLQLKGIVTAYPGKQYELTV